jgi:hypothetical protein
MAIFWRDKKVISILLVLLFPYRYFCIFSKLQQPTLSRMLFQTYFDDSPPPGGSPSIFSLAKVCMTCVKSSSSGSHLDEMSKQQNSLFKTPESWHPLCILLYYFTLSNIRQIFLSGVCFPTITLHIHSHIHRIKKGRFYRNI